jgi:hypothetical protein
MKKIDSGESAWQSSIFTDLTYIKKHLRYPWKRGLRIPIVFWGSLLLLAGLFYAFLFFTDSWTTKAPGSFWEVWVRYPVIWLFLIFIGLYRYIKSLRFRIVLTGLDRIRNQEIITGFLEKKQLLVYHHPESDDIMQIVSRPLSINNDRREALVFIADENRVLINSHFTGSKGWRLTLNGRHDRKMAADLQAYILSRDLPKDRGLRRNFH